MSKEVVAIKPDSSKIQESPEMKKIIENILAKGVITRTELMSILHELELKFAKNLYAMDKALTSVAETAQIIRLQAAVGGESPIRLQYQFERHMADEFALRKNMLDIEKELSERHTAYEVSNRERARVTERYVWLTQYMDDVLLNLRNANDKIVDLESTNKNLTLNLTAANQTITQFADFIKVFREKAEKKQDPADIIADLKRLMPEIFSAKKSSPSSSMDESLGENQEYPIEQ